MTFTKCRIWSIVRCFLLFCFAWIALQTAIINPAHATPVQQNSLDLRKNVNSIQLLNTGPSLNRIYSKTTEVGEAVQVQISASDPDNDPLTFSAAGLPTGLAISPTTGLISGTVSISGRYTPTVTVSDGIESVSDTFGWLVATRYCRLFALGEQLGNCDLLQEPVLILGPYDVISVQGWGLTNPFSLNITVPVINEGSISGGAFDSVYFRDSVTNYGIISFNSITKGEIENSTILTNTGTIYVDSGLRNYGRILNTGTLRVDGVLYSRLSAPRFENNLGSTIVNHGTLVVDSILENEGTIDNYGLLSADLDSDCDNEVFFSNASTGLVHNYGTIDLFSAVRFEDDGEIAMCTRSPAINHGLFTNHGVLNIGDANRRGWLINNGTLENRNMINNYPLSIVDNPGVIANNCEAVVNNDGTINDNMPIDACTPPGELGNVDCDNDIDAVDALFTLQYAVGLRADHGSCPLADTQTQLYAAAGDMDGSGATDAVDALFMLQCAVGLSNDYCGQNALLVKAADAEKVAVEATVGSATIITQQDGSTVTVQVSSNAVAVGAGMVEVRYDSSHAELTNCAIEGQGACHGSADGTIQIAFVDVDGLGDGQAVAELTFDNEGVVLIDVRTLMLADSAGWPLVDETLAGQEAPAKLDDSSVQLFIPFVNR